MNKSIALICISLFLASCATAYKNLGDPDGKEAYVIECREETWACFNKAAEVCPRGYITSGISAVGATSLLIFPTQLRTISIVCE